ncbi:PhzF family phenazine biosynthesis protein [Aldersonia sp. NBC_00410]|uniref:PhzF family phenazine biosynthesis protein n=1 Tax=Aldersonia sp. NBC_00410 TaxID=2975954 RepID=UPI0022559173|nr:PhzF family phenazine biosynthesis protein [Aldersonia sp. NBC_00410]MCX5046017.1 PhzF family phenazine biosynthesis protein [Aldersonia sp. NBC_00410]
MDLALYQIDAFADTPFSGNPAAVMPLPHWLPDATLQELALENNLSETAFYTAALPPDAGSAPDCPSYHLRWFTPGAEVDLCGHATLATGSHLLADVHADAARVAFFTRSGWLEVARSDAQFDTVERSGAGFDMDLPAEPPAPTEPPAELVAALGVAAVRALRATDEIIVVATSDEVRSVTPDFAAFPPLHRGVAVTAQGDEPGVDFVSRFFAPAVGIQEDPVTGSAHAQLAPFWAAEFGRTELVARQLSRRGGTVRCRVTGDRVVLTGACRRFLDGTAYLPDEVTR